jgi:hypothetical protein
VKAGMRTADGCDIGAPFSNDWRGVNRTACGIRSGPRSTPGASVHGEPVGVPDDRTWGSPSVRSGGLSDATPATPRFLRFAPMAARRLPFERMGQVV